MNGKKQKPKQRKEKEGQKKDQSFITSTIFNEFSVKYG